LTRRVRERGRNPAEDPAAWELALVATGLPPRYYRATADVIREPRVRAWLNALLPNAAQWLGDGAGFYLHGPLNVGKSSIAALLLMEAVMRFERALWLSVRDVPKMRFREGERGVWLDEQLSRADLVVLDDLGAERFRLESGAGPTLEETVRIVYDRARTLVVTSNIGWTEFTTRSEYLKHAPPLVSVIQRCCHPVEIVNNQWPLAPG
jgi:hypothetical protein